MSRERWFLSALIAYHVTALALAVFPSRDAMARFVETRAPASGPLPAALDALAGGLHAAQSAILSASWPVEPVTRPYVAAGVRQRWNMFSTPSVHDRYLRVHYHVRDATGSTSVHRELIFPTNDETRVRIVHRFRDKAMAAVVEEYFDRARALIDRPDGPSPAGAMEPVARYFTARFARSRLSGAQQVIRTEIWYGTAPIPPRGAPVDAAAASERLVALRRSRDPSRAAPPVPRDVRIGATTNEADITWRLLHVQEVR